MIRNKLYCMLFSKNHGASDLVLVVRFSPLKNILFPLCFCYFDSLTIPLSLRNLTCITFTYRKSNVDAFITSYLTVWIFLIVEIWHRNSTHKKEPHFQQFLARNFLSPQCAKVFRWTFFVRNRPTCSSFKGFWSKCIILYDSTYNLKIRQHNSLQSINYPIPTQWHLLTPLGNKPFENTVGKGGIACNEQFLLFPQCFLPVWITFCHFRQI